jgi:hypothetical protein
VAHKGVLHLVYKIAADMNDVVTIDGHPGHNRSNAPTCLSACADTTRHFVMKAGHSDTHRFFGNRFLKSTNS